MNENLIPEIVFENNDFLAVVKPYGMIVNNADTSAKVFTLQDWAKSNVDYETSKAQENLESEFEQRSGIVHRLDKETSGLILIAKNEEAFMGLQKEFKERRVKKTYFALCHGRVLDKGSVSMPIGRLPWNRKRFGIVPDGKSAMTEFEPIGYYKNPDADEVLTYLEVFPKTGRTHQIRVHMQYLKHPIYSDELYAGRKTARNDRRRLSRHFLHAGKLDFNFYKNGEKISLSTRLPNDLLDFLNSLEKTS